MHQDKGRMDVRVGVEVEGREWGLVGELPGRWTGAAEVTSM